MKTDKSSLQLSNDRISEIKNIPILEESLFRKKISAMIRSGKRLNAFFAVPENKTFTNFYAVIADDTKGSLNVISFRTGEQSFVSFTPKIPQFHLFEREIYEQTGIIPTGHPWLKPVRFPVDSKSSKNEEMQKPDIGDIDFFRISGQEIHQVAVGPVHAGIIEPGHFRFQCHGEIVHHLEISLGYQHRGIEEKIPGGPHQNTPYQVEVAAGDSSIAHATAYCQIIEQLAGAPVPEGAEKIRAIALELERCANHTGDLGALAGDIGFLPTMSYCGRIRGDFLNMTALICGNRFGRGLLCPGGVKHTMEPSRIVDLKKKVAQGKKDFISAVSLLWDTPSVLARFEGTGTVTTETAGSIGLVGVAARASGINTDCRNNHPSGTYKCLSLKMPEINSGDVLARARVRWEEVLESINIIEKLLNELPQEKLRTEVSKKLKPDTFAVSLVEGWRGEVCHVALTDRKGKFNKYKIIDPSFHNWFGLALALRGEQISDFPLCNKSFNLSYCGFDL